MTVVPNSIMPNAIMPNGVMPNGIMPNDIMPNGVHPFYPTTLKWEKSGKYIELSLGQAAITVCYQRARL